MIPMRVCPETGAGALLKVPFSVVARNAPPRTRPRVTVPPKSYHGRPARAGNDVRSSREAMARAQTVGECTSATIGLSHVRRHESGWRWLPRRYESAARAMRTPPYGASQSSGHRLICARARDRNLPRSCWDAIVAWESNQLT